MYKLVAVTIKGNDNFSQTEKPIYTISELLILA
jgi:hypothetical protein